MVYWAWILLGLGLLVVELALPGGFFALFFGLSALIVGGLVGLGWAGPQWMQWLLFSGISIVALAILRKPMQKWLHPKGLGKVDSLSSEAAIALEDIAVGELGKAELRGTSWNARNAGAEAIAKGQRLKVERVEGLTLHVHTE